MAAAAAAAVPVAASWLSSSSSSAMVEMRKTRRGPASSPLPLPLPRRLRGLHGRTAFPARAWPPGRWSCAAVGDQGGSIGGGGMSVEEKNAILEFEGMSLEEEEDGGGGERAVSEGEGKKEEGEEEEEEEEPKVRRRLEMYEPGPARRVTGRGADMADVVGVFVGLLQQPLGGGGRMVAAAGGAVLERLEGEAAELDGAEGVDGQHLFEVLRMLKLLRMDLQLVAASRQGGTLRERLDQTLAHCMQLLDILAVL